MDNDKVKLEALDYAIENDCVSKDVISAYIYGYSSGYSDKKNEFILDNYKIHEVLTIFKNKLTNKKNQFTHEEERILNMIGELISILRPQGI